MYSSKTGSKESETSEQLVPRALAKRYKHLIDCCTCVATTSSRKFDNGIGIKRCLVSKRIIQVADQIAHLIAMM